MWDMATMATMMQVENIVIEIVTEGVTETMVKGDPGTASTLWISWRLDLYRLRDENAEVAEARVDLMEQCFRVLHYDEDEKTEVADFIIQGKARKWWKSVSAILVQQHGWIRWEHFRQVFINHHFPPAFRQAKEMELLTIKQGDSSIEDYQKRLTDLLPYAPHISENSAAK